MASELSFFLSALIGAICVGLSAARLARVRRLASEVPARLGELRAGVSRSAIERLANSFQSETPLRRLIDSALRAPSRAHAVAEMNEQIAEIEQALDALSPVPRAAARIAVTSGVLLAILGFLSGDAARSESSWQIALGAALAGAAAALVAAALGRRADRLSASFRERVNALVRALAGAAGPE
jgi:hypothetical protein